MIWLYRIFYLPALLLSLPYYLWRTFKRGGYARDSHHRLGLLPRLPRTERRRLWIQAVSVGELLSIEAIVKELAEEEAVEIVLTTTTSTGYVLAHDRMGKHCVAIGYFPLDFILFSWLAWIRLKPDLILMVDSELWPEHVHRAGKRGCPVLLLNARLSDTSYRRYLRFGLARRLCFDPVDCFLAASEQDSRRIRDLGIPSERIILTGNLKFDKSSEVSLSAEAKRSLLEAMFPGTQTAESKPLIVLGSSTWPGEEQALVEAMQRLEAACLAVRLILVPRHAERREALRKELEATGQRCHFRTDSRPPPAETRIYVADTTGELPLITQIADIVYVGKSLPPHTQGQSPIEAAASGKAILMGPGMSNFRQVVRELLKLGGAEIVDSAEALAVSLQRLCRDSERRRSMGRASLQWHQEQRGAAERSLVVIRQTLAKMPKS